MSLFVSVLHFLPLICKVNATLQCATLVKIFQWQTQKIIPFSSYDIFPIHSLLHFEYKIIQGSLTFHALTRNQVIENTLCKHLIDRVLQYCTFTSSILNFIQKQFSNSYLILRTFLPRSFVDWLRFRSFWERAFAILSLAHDNVSAFKILRNEINVAWRNSSSGHDDGAQQASPSLPFLSSNDARKETLTFCWFCANSASSFVVLLE